MTPDARGRSPRAYWLMKSEPSVFSIEDLRRLKVSGWDGVRNYQARNYMRLMRKGDGVLFYHSSAEPAGVAGLAEVVRTAYPDPTQFDAKNERFDPRAAQEAPVWFQVDVRFVKAFGRLLSAAELRSLPELKDMVLFKRGRLSVQPVAAGEWSAILKKAGL